MTFVVDGYNLLHRAYPALLKEHGLEGARLRLEHKLREFLATGDRHTRVVLVYDGAAGGGCSRRERTGRNRLQIRFSRPPRRADDLILDLCRQAENVTELQVVTSDELDIGSRVRGLKCRHWTSESFASLVAQRLARRAGGHGSGTPEARDDPPRLSDRNVDDWLRAFDMHPESDDV